jgi:hypothetical protein
MRKSIDTLILRARFQELHFKNSFEGFLSEKWKLIRYVHNCDQCPNKSPSFSDEPNHIVNLGRATISEAGAE